MLTHRQKIQHLLHRAGFGASPKEVANFLSLSIEESLEKIIPNGQIEPLLTLKNPVKNADKDISGIKLGFLILKSKGQLEKLNLDWLEQMGNTAYPLWDKMTYFWHDHFATSTPIAYLMQTQHNTIRKHALGKFGDLLHAMAKDPAMLLYLNNHQNKKDAPNENFAREVMELFTLSEGNYSELDIKQAARSFTGWTVNMRGEFEFNQEEYDEGEKQIFGHEGAFKGEDVINMLLKNKDTAKYVVNKIYTFFVNAKVNKAHVEPLIEDFYNSDYDISRLMTLIFSSEWFYDPSNVGTIIKPPVILLAEYMRTFGLQFRNRKLLLDSQKALDQVLFFPPNVAGWPQGRQWIDSSSLLFRMKLPEYLLGDKEFDVDLDPKYEEMAKKGAAKRIPQWQKPSVNWELIVQYFHDIPESDLPRAVLGTFIQAPHDHISTEFMNQFADKTSKSTYIQTLVIRALSLPEFQLA